MDLAFLAPVGFKTEWTLPFWRRHDSKLNGPCLFGASRFQNLMALAFLAQA